VTISRNNVKTFASAEGMTPSTLTMKKKRDKIELGVAQKQLDIARVRGYDAAEVFTYDLVETRELHGNGDSGNTAVIRGNLAVMGTTPHISPR